MNEKAEYVPTLLVFGQERDGAIIFKRTSCKVGYITIV